MDASACTIRIKTEPGIPENDTPENILYGELKQSQIKIEPSSEEWKPNYELETDTEGKETTIRIESVAGASEHNIETESGLKTEEIDISDLEFEDDSDSDSNSDETVSQQRGTGISSRLLDAKSYQCASCLTSFRNKRRLTAHIAEICFRNLSSRIKGELKRRLAAEDEVQVTSLGRLRRSKTLKCLKCRKTFKSDSDLKVHKIEFHPKLLSHRCEVCGKGFAKNSHKLRHMGIHTVSGRVHKCDQCNIVFTQSQELKNHFKFVHPELRPYKCEYCDKSFFRTCHRSRHINIHTQKIDYSCKICDSKFTQGSNLRSHMLIHADIRRYVCNVCGKKFRQGSDHKKHMLIHTGERPHNCRTCDKPFQTISSRNHHERIHSGVRNYVCAECSRPFVSNCHLKRHMLTHNKEKKRQFVPRRRKNKIKVIEEGSESDDWELSNGSKTLGKEKICRKIVTRGRKKKSTVIEVTSENEILDTKNVLGTDGDLKAKLKSGTESLPKQERCAIVLKSACEKLPIIKIEEDSNLSQ